LLVPAAASSPEGWVDPLTRLLAKEPLWADLGAAGRRFVDEHHHRDRCLQPLRDLRSLGNPDASGVAATVRRQAASCRRPLQRTGMQQQRLPGEYPPGPGNGT